MKITDLNGQQIEVTDLNEAIAQADSFRRFRHQDPAHENRDKYLQGPTGMTFMKSCCCKAAQAAKVNTGGGGSLWPAAACFYLERKR